MRLVGIIAEYDPFHTGHAYHLREAKKRAGADAAVVVMSTAFTQRGGAALLSPDDRAQMALRCGVDVVIALPAIWAVRAAEDFALGGVAILNALGCDSIAFGAENDDLPLLQRAAALLEAPDPQMRTALRAALDSGLSHPAALSAACAERLPEAQALLASPNNTLALCYLRAMLRLGATMTPVPVRREGDYHATALDAAAPSATALRGAILRGDWQSARRAMPPEAFAVLEAAAAEGRIHRPDALDQTLLYRLWTIKDEDLSALPHLSEGIETRLLQAARLAVTKEILLKTAKTRRYPRARISRLCTHALLGFTQALFDELPLPPSAWLLGFREEAAPVLTALKQRATIPLVSRAAEVSGAPWFAAEQRAWDTWCLGAGLPAGLALTRRVLRIETE